MTDDIQTPSASGPDPQYPGQEQGKEEGSVPKDQPQDGPSSPGSAQEQGKKETSEHQDKPQDDPSSPSSAQQQEEEGNHAPGDQPQDGSSPSSSGEDKEMVITSIQAKEPALGLRRLPAGFYTVVRHSGNEWRTENKRSSVNDNVVEWRGPIPLPSDRSATVALEVYASFEFQPMLGTGEHLRKLTITMDQLLDRSTKHVPFTLFPKNGDIVSPCSSILVTVKQRNGESSDSSASRVLGPICSTTETLNELEDATNHGHSALSHYRKHGEKRDLEHSVAEFERALNNCPVDHPCHAAALSNLAMAKLILCRVKDTIASLEIPIRLCCDALAARPVGHTDRPSTLVQLAAVHLARFEKQRDNVDGAQVETLLHEAMELSATDSDENRVVSVMLQLYAGHRFGPDHASSQSPVDLHSSSHLIDEDPWSSSVQLLKRFQRHGDLADLQRAITLLQQLVRSVSVWDDRYRVGLGNLGGALRLRFKHLGELRDLEDAISTHRDAVHLTPDGHPDKPGFLNNLGLSFITRFKRLGELRDLEDAISTHRDAVHLTPDGHPDKPGFLNNLGLSFRARFERLGELRDLEDAISTHRDGVHLTPDGHPEKPTCLNNLGLSFITRFERLGELRDLEDAISTHRDAVHLTPDGHPDKPGRLNNLGSSFRARFERLRELRDLEAAISLYSHAASVPIGPISDRFRASRNWILYARRIHHPSLLRAYSIAINLLPQLAWIGLSLTHRYAELRRGADVVREAAAAALDSGFPELAVEWLEQGRSIVWGELLQLRGSYEQLSSAHPDHARRLRELSAALDDAGATREKPLSTFSESTDDPIHRATQTLQQVVDTHRTLAIERDKLLQDIRRLPDFNRFLLPKDFSQLRASAHSGPVVVLNAAERRCDALIVLANVDHVIHVPLPNFTFQRSIDLQGILKSFLRCTLVERTGQVERWDRGTWETFLSPLWKCVVEPVMDALAFSTPGDLSRIFWCPTGPFVFLPIHAAGLYDAEYSAPGHKVFDFVVSSYVPTLSILAPSRNIYVAHNGDFRLLAVRQPPTDGRQLSRLPGVHTELKHIKEIITNTASGCATFLEPSVGTVEEVLGLMKEADWVHFACHGIQDARNPTDSGLCLANERRLKISDIIGLSRSRGGLAFLSACQTATGDEGLSDEAVHIAAGMLFAGYAGVIGTMWSISDKLAPIVARDVYEHLFRNGTRPDYREAAWALHEAIGRQRDGEVSFNEWVPFIHVGL
ncbi:CHAT domain-containing protein [Boletus edulis BED1]|uniref:CHAT domain-containing protein n=1 Tax=Boletus edulis BED1 TaxID=1328754 RepID=A0AAD4BKP7_BOLED|nr:CHAT domain-containing protein [Boletus edulis BED1]